MLMLGWVRKMVLGCVGKMEKRCAGGKRVDILVPSRIFNSREASLCRDLILLWHLESFTLKTPLLSEDACFHRRRDEGEVQGFGFK
jgi:hypothetical protein